MIAQLFLINGFVRKPLGQAAIGFALCALCAACVPAESPPKEPGPADYSDAGNWLNVPAVEKAAYIDNKPVDVFYLYPTCHFTRGKVCSAADEDIRREARFLREAHFGIFNSANVYAPFYRQLSIGYIEELLNEQGPQGVLRVLRDIPGVDAINAFIWYLENYNKGRPVIFASHSQGSGVMELLLPWIRENRPEALERMVAAYIIGAPVQEEFLAQAGLPFAAGPLDTGVVISYSTELAATEFNPFQGGLAINPVNWRTDETPAGKEESLGSRVRYGYSAPVDIPHFAGAQLNLKRGTVETNADIASGPPWPAGVLHRYDYDLFYYNLQKNVEDRITAWFAAP
jgi:hypothetical protein